MQPKTFLARFFFYYWKFSQKHIVHNLRRLNEIFLMAKKKTESSEILEKVLKITKIKNCFIKITLKILKLCLQNKFM